MKRVAIITLAIITFTASLAGCGTNGDKEKLLNWMHSINVENTEASFWCDNGKGELLLSEDDAQALVAILSEIKTEDITWNKDLAGITPQYGLHLIIDGISQYINQAEAPGGQTAEVSFRDKQWWIKSEELKDFMLLFFEQQ